MTFKELNLSESILTAIAEMGYENPTPIQEQTIPILLAGTQDYVGLAQTGTGKTAAFGLPLLELIDVNKNYPQALVLAPTRELCMQIHNELLSFSKNMTGLKAVAVYGGADIVKQMKQIERGVQIVVATPGRLIDLAKRKAVDLKKIDFLVLDEADEMLNMGFKEDLDTILTFVENRKSIWLFSATMPKEVRSIAANYMTDPKEVVVGTKNAGNENIENRYYVVEGRNRDKALKRIIDSFPDIYGIVFCRTRMETKEVADNLMASGYNADALHGDLSQAQRDSVMKKFKNKNLSILVATDVAARGIDVDDVTHVINYNLPDDIEVYTHRSGRTARAGKKGVSIVIVSPREVSRITAIERMIKQRFFKTEVPNAEEVCEKQLLSYIDRIKETSYNVELDKFIVNVLKEMEDLSKEDIIKKVATLNFNDLLSYYSNASDLNYGGKSDRRDRGVDDVRGEGRRNSGARFFINIGRKDNYGTGEIINFLVENTGVNGKEIGRIDVKDAFSFFEVDQESVEVINNTIKNNNIDLNGRKINIEAAGERPARSDSGFSRRSGGGNSGGGEFKRRFNGGGDSNRSGGSGDFKKSYKSSTPNSPKKKDKFREFKKKQY